MVNPTEDPLSAERIAELREWAHAQADHAASLPPKVRRAKTTLALIAHHAATQKPHCDHSAQSWYVDRATGRTGCDDCDDGVLTDLLSECDSLSEYDEDVAAIKAHVRRAYEAGLHAATQKPPEPDPQLLAIEAGLAPHKREGESYYDAACTLDKRCAELEASLVAYAERASRERERANQYECDWMAAKYEFGTSMGLARTRIAELEGLLREICAACYGTPIGLLDRIGAALSPKTPDQEWNK